MASCVRFATLVTAASFEVMQRIHYLCRSSSGTVDWALTTLTLHLRLDFALTAHLERENGP